MDRASRVSWLEITYEESMQNHTNPMGSQPDGRMPSSSHALSDWDIITKPLCNDAQSQPAESRPCLYVNFIESCLFL
jgi:hypothetical protein